MVQSTYASLANLASNESPFDSQNFSANSKQFIFDKPVLSSSFNVCNITSGCGSERNIATSTRV